jgi:hypothetical protein
MPDELVLAPLVSRSASAINALKNRASKPPHASRFSGDRLILWSVTLGFVFISFADFLILWATGALFNAEHIRPTAHGVALS